LHDENDIKRKELMRQNRIIIDGYLKKYEDWIKTRDILHHINNIKKVGKAVHRERYESFKNKRGSKDEFTLADILLKSTSDFYVNRAIEVLKDENLKGKGEECLSIISRIFKL
jgi:glutamyl-tRNA reductase